MLQANYKILIYTYIVSVCGCVFVLCFRIFSVCIKINDRSGVSFFNSKI